MINFTSDAVTAVGTAILTLAGGVPAFRAFTKKAIPVVEKEAPVIAHDANVVEKFFVNLAKSPLFAGIAAKGKVEAHHVLAQLENSELAKAALKGVGVFNKALGVTLDEMTATQKTDLVEFVKSELAKAKMNMTDAQIVLALKTAQDALDSVEKNVIPTVQAHDAAVKAWGTANAAQTSPTDNGQAS